MNIDLALRQTRARIAAVTGDPREADAMARLIFHALKGWSSTDLVIHSADEASPFILGRIDEILERLAKSEPLQYILGATRFYGMDLDVDRHTLIPRPETEELVELMVGEYRDCPDLRVLDIGTGSGAIALALSRNLPFSRVTALDVSEGALAVARRNAARLHARIDFLCEDVFAYTPAPGSFDLIVSNPPYIALSESSSMDSRVLDYEPHGALFVPDSDPLLFYRRIAAIALRAFSSAGSGHSSLPALWLEINPIFAEPLKEMLIGEGFENVSLINDMTRRPRFAYAQAPCIR